MKKRIMQVIVFIVLLSTYCIVQTYLTNVTNQPIENETSYVPATLAYCIDGDTAAFMVDGEKVKVRFTGIDTPEYSKHNKQPLGKEAATFTCDKLQQANSLGIEWEEHEEATYDRKVGVVFIDDVNLNTLLLEEGLADTKYLKKRMKYYELYKEIENKAKAEKVGLWVV